MIATTLATWTLVVSLRAPMNPEYASGWSMRYSPFNTPEACESYAKTIWVKYYDRFVGTGQTAIQTLTTTCNAYTAHTVYSWFIQCNEQKNCETDKLKNPR